MPTRADAAHCSANLSVGGGLEPRSTHLVALGEVVSLAPLAAEELRLEPEWLNATESAESWCVSRSCVFSSYAPTRAWARVAERMRSHRRLHVTVLGTSPTAGCGAGEPWAAPANVSLGRQCTLGRSWGRRLHDELRTVLRRALPGQPALRLTVRLSYKNAVAAEFFARCTSSHLSNTTDLVLAEFATNLWGSNVTALLASLRAVAPRAPIVIAGWTAQRPAALDRAIEESARAAGADVVRMSRVLERVALPPPWGLSLPQPTFYAGRGKDKVHPNPKGHALFGATVARFVAGRLLGAECSRMGGGGGRSEEAEEAEEAEAAAGASDASWPWELCWDSGDKLPVATPLNGTWAVVDDGGAKGVPKLGLASSAVGERLLLQPLPAPPGAACAMMCAPSSAILLRPP